MSLVPCRACNYTVDTTAIACPSCGATNPGHKLSRQQHDLIIWLIQVIVGCTIVYMGVSAAWKAVGPIVKQQLVKPQQ